MQKLMTYIYIIDHRNPNKKPRNITAARVGNTNNLSKYLKLISLYAFGLKTAPA